MTALQQHEVASQSLAMTPLTKWIRPDEQKPIERVCEALRSNLMRPQKHEVEIKNRMNNSNFIRLLSRIRQDWLLK
jgi:hypothetical protein